MSTEGLIIDVDYDITKAEAKQRKLNGEMEISRQKVENIKKNIAGLNNELASEERLQKDIKNRISEQTQEAAKLEQQIQKVKNGTATIGETTELGGLTSAEQKLSKMEKLIQKNYSELEKSNSKHNKISKEIDKQNIALIKQNATTANIGNQILLNSKKQNKFAAAFSKSTKSADRFAKRIKSLIASALFFSVITKAFTALRNEFGKLITETGTKIASLVAQLKSNLATLGRTLYESAKPYIEWILNKLVHITQLITEAIAKALGKNVNEMRKLANSTEDVAKNSEKATASFDTLQKINSTSTTGTTNTSTTVNTGTSNDDLKKTKEWLERILPLVTAVGIGFAAWKIGGLLTQMGVLNGTVGSIVKGIGLVVIGASLLFTATVNWNDELHNGENTLNAIISTVGTILIIIGLIIAGVTAWPVLLVGGLLILGMWYDNFKNKVDKWIESLPAGIYEIVDIIKIAAYGVWDFIKNLFKGLYEIFTGDWEKGLKRIGIAFVNLLVDGLNIVIQALNDLFMPIRNIITEIGRLAGKKWSIKDVAIPKIPRIPQLATGAILPGGSPMLAWVNDQPKGQPYVEGSIDNIAAAFEKYLGDKGFGSQNITIEANGNWAQFIKWMNLEIKRESKRASVWG